MGNLWPSLPDVDDDEPDDDLGETVYRNEQRRAEEFTCAYPGRCLCPHFSHHRSECFTADDCEEWAADVEYPETAVGD